MSSIQPTGFSPQDQRLWSVGMEAMALSVQNLYANAYWLAYAYNNAPPFSDGPKPAGMYAFNHIGKEFSRGRKRPTGAYLRWADTYPRGLMREPGGGEIDLKDIGDYYSGNAEADGFQPLPMLQSRHMWGETDQISSSPDYYQLDFNVSQKIVVFPHIYSPFIRMRIAAKGGDANTDTSFKLTLYEDWALTKEIASSNIESDTGTSPAAYQLVEMQIDLDSDKDVRKKRIEMGRKGQPGYLVLWFMQEDEDGLVSDNPTNDITTYPGLALTTISK